MITKIIDQLKTGNIKNNYRFGQAFNPKVPYNVVKIETDGFGRGEIVRVFSHYAPGQDLFLDSYSTGELIELLDGFQAVDRFGNTNVLQVMRFGEQPTQGIITDNRDGTISQERRFLMPSMTF